jgi:hypothetical protein
MPSLRPPSSALWGAAFALVGTGAACAGHAGLPLVPHAGLVSIGIRTVPAAAVVLSPFPEGSGAGIVALSARALAAPSSRIVIRGPHDGPPPGAVAPAFLVDGRLWCPRRGPTGRYTELAGPVQALEAGAITSIEVIRDAAAAPYARRCAAPVDAVVRVQTRTPRR